MKYQVKVEGRMFEVEVGDLDARPVMATVDGERFEVWPEPAIGAAAPAAVSPRVAPATPRVESEAPRPSRRTSGAEAAPPGKAGKVVYAPLPGVIYSIAVKPGDRVEAGQELCVVEAMKMKNLIRASQAGEIGEVHIQVGQHVRHNDALVEYAG